MRLFEFDDSNLLRLVDTIKDECKVLQSFKNTKTFLYRGLHHAKHNLSQNYFFGKSPENRKSKGLVQSDHKTINKCLEIAGFNARRDNSICCATLEQHAKNFANAIHEDKVYIIFPLYKFDFLWSITTKDLGGQGIPKELRKSFNRISKKSTPITKEDADFIIYYLGFKNNDFNAALKSKHEILIHGEYIAVGIEFKNQVEQLLGF